MIKFDFAAEYKNGGQLNFACVCIIVRPAACNGLLQAVSL